MSVADKTDKKSGGLGETVSVIVQALLLALVIRTFLFQPFSIPSGSMRPTLLEGDYLFVTKWAYGYSRHSLPFSPPLFDGRIWGGEPERGDVAVFRHPVTGRDFIKRVVGLPGDRIQFNNGVLFINDVPVELEEAGVFEEVVELQGPGRVRPRCANGIVGMGGICEKQRQTETLPGGREHIILNIENRSTDNTGVYTVPAGHFFFVGDNRDNSSDSRIPQSAGGVGFVPFEDLVGRADRVLFSSAGTSLFAFWTWRGDRFFHKIE